MTSINPDRAALIAKIDRKTYIDFTTFILKKLRNGSDSPLNIKEVLPLANVVAQEGNGRLRLEVFERLLEQMVKDGILTRSSGNDVQYKLNPSCDTKLWCAHDAEVRWISTVRLLSLWPEDVMQSFVHVQTYLEKRSPASKLSKYSSMMQQPSSMAQPSDQSSRRSNKKKEKKRARGQTGGNVSNMSAGEGSSSHFQKRQRTSPKSIVPPLASNMTGFGNFHNSAEPNLEVSTSMPFIKLEEDTRTREVRPTTSIATTAVFTPSSSSQNMIRDRNDGKEPFDNISISAQQYLRLGGEVASLAQRHQNLQTMTNQELASLNDRFNAFTNLHDTNMEEMEQVRKLGYENARRIADLEEGQLDQISKFNGLERRFDLQATTLSEIVTIVEKQTREIDNHKVKTSEVTDKLDEQAKLIVLLQTNQLKRESDAEFNNGRLWSLEREIAKVPELENHLRSTSDALTTTQADLADTTKNLDDTILIISEQKANFDNKLKAQKIESETAIGDLDTKIVEFRESLRRAREVVRTQGMASDARESASAARCLDLEDQIKQMGKHHTREFQRVQKEHSTAYAAVLSRLDILEDAGNPKKKQKT